MVTHILPLTNVYNNLIIKYLQESRYMTDKEFREITQRVGYNIALEMKNSEATRLITEQEAEVEEFTNLQVGE